MIPEEKIAELKLQHGELHILEAGEHQVVVRPPARSEYRRFRAYAVDDRKKLEATETLLRDCAVYPEPEELTRLFDKKPALPDVFGAKVLELAGATEEASVKKL